MARSKPPPDSLRPRTEDQLATAMVDPEPASPLAETGTIKLLHELQAHRNR